jgi:putative flippase GtrA
MTIRWNGSTPGSQTTLSHGLGFLLSGSIAFLVDAAILTALTSLAGLHPVVARVFAISIAMVAGWLSHRRFTFRLAISPSVPEFLRYAAVGWVAAALNYAVFVAIVLVWPGIVPVYALVVSSLITMTFSYLVMRFAVFRDPSKPT